MTVKKNLIVSLSVLIAFLGAFFTTLMTQTINSLSVLIKEVNVTNDVIEVQGVFTDGFHFQN